MFYNVSVDQSILLRAILARTLLVRARNEVKDRHDDNAVATAVLHMHDCVDNFLGAVASHLDIHIPAGKDSMMQVYEKIESAGGLQKFGYKTELNQLNTMRNAIKHSGVMPNPAQVIALVGSVTNFCNEVAEECFDVKLDNIYVSLLIQHDKKREALQIIEALIEKGDYENAMRQAGIALFQYFDATQWQFSPLRLATAGLQPEDEINVFPEGGNDKARLDLMEHNIDPYLYHRFKNLTPEIGYDNLRDRNIIARHDDLRWHDKNWTKENASFCLSFLSNLFLKQQRNYGGYTIYEKRGVYTLTFTTDSTIYIKRGGELLELRRASTGEIIEGSLDSYANGEWQQYDKDFDSVYAHVPIEYINGKLTLAGYYINKDDITIERDEHVERMSY